MPSFLLLDSGAQLHACPITYAGQKIPLRDPGVHTASGARLQHDGGRLVTQTSTRTNNWSAFPRVCSLETSSVSWLFSLSRGAGVIFVQTLEHCSFLTRSRRNVATHTVAQGREFVLCQRDDDCALDDSWTKSLESYKCQ